MDRWTEIDVTTLLLTVAVPQRTTVRRELENSNKRKCKKDISHTDR